MSAESMEHLAKANGVRLARAEVKRQLRSGELRLASAMEQPCMQGMAVYDVLRIVPKIGRVKAERLPKRLGIKPTRYVGQLTARQRAELVEAMP